MKSRLLKALIAAGLAFLSAFTGFEIGKSIDASTSVVEV